MQACWPAALRYVRAGKDARHQCGPSVHTMQRQVSTQAPRGRVGVSTGVLIVASYSVALAAFSANLRSYPWRPIACKARTSGDGHQRGAKD